MENYTWEWDCELFTWKCGACDFTWEDVTTGAYDNEHWLPSDDGMHYCPRCGKYME